MYILYIYYYMHFHFFLVFSPVVVSVAATTSAVPFMVGALFNEDRTVVVLNQLCFLPDNHGQRG